MPVSTFYGAMSGNREVRGYTLDYVVPEHNGEGEPRYISRKALVGLNDELCAMRERGNVLCARKRQGKRRRSS